MKLQDFFYALPKELIAQYPLEKRDQARLMVVDRQKNTIRHDIFANVGKYLPPQSLIVLNNSKVIPARLLGKREKSNGKVEIFLLKQLNDGCSYQALIRPLRRIKSGEKVRFDGGRLVAQVTDFKEKIVRFSKGNVARYLEKFGRMPLPPYIKREDTTDDRLRYQTVFAKPKGSVAAPTAGLHFTEDLLFQLKGQGHQIEKVTLHINYATFKPVEVEDITKHPMHEEEYFVSFRSWQDIKKAKKQRKTIVAVGTTSTRVLEAVAENKRLSGSTNIFIYPGCAFKMVDILVTNFHLPYSTLLMLVYAFGGKDLIQRAYREAIKEKYRFYSYGDAMVIV